MVGYGKFVKIENPAGLRAIAVLHNEHPKSVGTVFSKLLECIDHTNGLICTQSQLAAECGVGLNTIKRAFSTLKRLQYIKVRKIAQGLLVEVNARIATKSSQKKAVTEAGYEIWNVNILLNKQ